MKVGDLVLKADWTSGEPARIKNCELGPGIILEVDLQKNSSSWNIRHDQIVYRVLWSNGIEGWEVPGRVLPLEELIERDS